MSDLPVKNPRVVLTGGGTAGHVVPNLAFAKILQGQSIEPVYIGSNGMEKGLAVGAGLPFRTIVTGKLRRELTLKNIVMPFRVLWGFLQSFLHLRSIQPIFVFSKGGFVSVPVCFAAWLLGIPCYTHESDLSPGLANRLIKKVCKKFFYTFPQTKKHLPSSAEWVGSPLRPEIANASAQAGFDFLGWEQNGKPLLFVVGGSLGSERLNKALHKILPQLVEQLRVVHVTGEGKKIDFKHKNYSSHAFIRGEYADVLAAADFVLARAGANSIFEFLALQKPMLLMPLGAGSRGDQIENAQSFLQRGWAQVIDEQALDDASLEIAIENLQASAGQIKQKQSEYKAGNALEKIWQSISADLGPVS